MGARIDGGRVWQPLGAARARRASITGCVRAMCPLYFPPGAPLPFRFV
jgi:hypothetical protein